MNSDYILQIKNVTKRFPGVVALRDVSIALKGGEVLAICGENGAGKSTLMKILSGSYRSGEYEGEIWIDGKPVDFTSVAVAEGCGIEMVYQELNVMLGRLHRRKHLCGQPADQTWPRRFQKAV